MSIGAGLTSAIMNPMHTEDLCAVLGADVMMGHDANCMHWMRKFREPNSAAAADGRRGRRESRRRRAAAG